MISTSQSLRASALRRQGGRLLGEWVGAVVATVRAWSLRARQRRELRELDDVMLRDIGISRSQARFSADRPFWRD